MSELEELRERYDARKQEAAVAKARNEEAEKELSRLLKEAQELYGIQSVEEAQEKLAALEKKIEQRTDELESALEAVDA